MKIAIDIGHADGTGAKHAGQEEHATVEAFVNNALLPAFKKAGYTDVDIIDYPDKSNTDDLNQTVSAANARGYDVLISCHRDAASSEVDAEGFMEPHGAHAIHFSTSINGKLLAKLIMKKAGLAKILPGRSEIVQARDGLAILKRTKCVAVLLELGFITNKNDREIFENKADKIASCIVKGVTYYKKEKGIS